MISIHFKNKRKRRGKNVLATAKVINFRNYVRIENSLRKNKRIGCTV